MFSGRRLPLTLAFAGLLMMAFGAGCRGFFPKPVLQSIAINPTAPQVSVGQTQTLQAFGTYDDGNRSAITSGVGWSSSDPTVATITGAGSAVITGVAPGSTTISASAQALSATASATVVLAGAILSVTPVNESVTIPNTANPFTFTATAGSTVINVTTANGGTLTITPTTTDITCTATNGTEVCATDSATALGTYTLTMTYAGATNSVSATLNVN